MGMIRHHAIVVTSFSLEEAKQARGIALQVFGDRVSGLVGPVTNGYVSFFIAPDGSKEFWPESDQGDRNRSLFMGRLRESKFMGRAVEVAFGENGPYMVTGSVGDAYAEADQAAKGGE